MTLDERVYVPWRLASKTHIITDNGEHYLGEMETPELAEEVVKVHNANLAPTTAHEHRYPPVGLKRFGRDQCLDCNMWRIP